MANISGNKLNFSFTKNMKTIAITATFETRCHAIELIIFKKKLEHSKEGLPRRVLRLKCTPACTPPAFSPVREEDEGLVAGQVVGVLLRQLAHEPQATLVLVLRGELWQDRD